MKKNLFVLVALLLSASVFAQSDTNRQTATTYPENGKFEIITSSLTMRDTLMLNRETGDTWQLVSTSKGKIWKKIYRANNYDDQIPDGYKGAVYQITMSGVAAKGIYLTNTFTGATWVLYADSKTDELFWGAEGTSK